MIVPVGFATITALCVYEVDIRWSVDFRGGNIHLTWRLKRVVEPEFWCSFALTDGISARIADKSLSNRSQLLQAGRSWHFLLSLFLCTDLDDAHSDCWKANVFSWEMFARTNWFCIFRIVTWEIDCKHNDDLTLRWLWIVYFDFVTYGFAREGRFWSAFQYGSGSTAWLAAL